MITEFSRIAARAIIRHEGRILVEWLESERLSFLPGGAVESGEELEHALLRELHEELDEVEPTVLGYLGRIGHRWSTPDGSEDCLNHYFEVRLDRPEAVRAREPGREMRWLPLDPAGLVTLRPPSLPGLLLSSTASPWSTVDAEL